MKIIKRVGALPVSMIRRAVPLQESQQLCCVAILQLLLPLLVVFLIGTASVYAEDGGSQNVADLNITIQEPVDLKCVYDADYLYDAVRVDGKTLDEWNDWPWRDSLQITAQTDGPGEGTVTINGINSYTGELVIPAIFKFKPTKDELSGSLNLKIVNFDECVPYTGKTQDPIASWAFDLYHYSKYLPNYNGGKWDKRLKEGRDYELVGTSYEGGKKIGPAKVSHTLRFFGDYDGTVTTTYKYKVVPTKVKVKKNTAGKGKITFTIAKHSSQTDGFRVLVYDRNKRDKIVKTKVFRNKKQTTFVIKGLTSGHWCDYSIEAYKTVNGKKYYSERAYNTKVMKIK